MWFYFYAYALLCFPKAYLACRQQGALFFIVYRFHPPGRNRYTGGEKIRWHRSSFVPDETDIHAVRRSARHLLLVTRHSSLVTAAKKRSIA
jgi:hypothetical protein